MSELRKDPVVDRWVIIAPERALRPSDFRRPSVADAGRLCPFCPGNESLTTPELLAIRAPESGRDRPGWRLRVVPNRYPALRIEGHLAREGEGLFDRVTGIGAHEVVIETAHHDRGLAQLPASEVEDVLWAWSERIRDLSNDHRMRAIPVFRNHGDAAGATLLHPHSQLIALPLVPRVLEDALTGGAAHYAKKHRCLWCDVMRQEQKDTVRLVDESEHAIALTPWASRSPFELRVMPKTHRSSFEGEPRAIVKDVAVLLKRVLQRLDVALEQPAFNLVLQSAPLREPALPHYHWHIEIVPALVKAAGFEQGTGYAINPVAPEEAAAFLRKASIE